MKLSFLSNLTFLYSVGVTGAFLQIAGAQWDVSAHILGIVESFFTPAHTVLYSGIVLVAAANLLGLFFMSRSSSQTLSSLYTGFRIGVFGTAIQIVAGPFDFWWHSVNGFDPFLFTPAHSLLIIGMVLGGIGMTYGTVRLYRAQRSGLQLANNPRLLTGILILSLAAIWGQLNFFSYWITDVRGMAYTFGYCSIENFRAMLPCAFADQNNLVAFLEAEFLFASAGTLVFWTSKKTFLRTGPFIAVALILAAVYSAATFGFTAYALQFLNPVSTWYYPNPSPDQAMGFAFFIPLYLLALIPMMLLDAAVKNTIMGRTLIAVSGLVGPFAAFMDGRFLQGLSQAGIEGLEISAVMTIVGGAIGGLFVTRLTLRMFIGPIASQTLLPQQSPR